MPLDSQGRQRAPTKYERKLAEIEAAALRESFVNVVEPVTDEVPSCRLHSWGFKGEGSAPKPLASQCPFCNRERLERRQRERAPRVVVVSQTREPTRREALAWDSYLSEHEEELLAGGKVHLIDSELEKEAVAYIDGKRKEEIADLALTPEQRFEKRRRRHKAYWRRRLVPRKHDLVIEVEGVGVYEGGRFEPEDGTLANDAWDSYEPEPSNWLARYLKERHWRKLRRKRDLEGPALDREGNTLSQDDENEADGDDA